MSFDKSNLDQARRLDLFVRYNRAAGTIGQFTQVPLVDKAGADTGNVVILQLDKAGNVALATVMTAAEGAAFDEVAAITALVDKEMPPPAQPKTMRMAATRTRASKTAQTTTESSNGEQQVSAKGDEPQGGSGDGAGADGAPDQPQTQEQSVVSDAADGSVQENDAGAVTGDTKPNPFAPK